MIQLRFLLILAAALVAIQPAQAQRPDAPIYGRRGPFAVGLREYTLDDPQRPLRVSMWYPAVRGSAGPKADYGRFGVGVAIPDAQPDTANGPYPLAVFSHGYTAERNANPYFTEHLASYGFVVLSADHPDEQTLSQAVRNDRSLAAVEGTFALYVGYALRPFDVLREIDFAAALTAKGGAFEGLIDTERIVVAGHSFGGYTALAVGGARIQLDSLARWCDSPPPTELVPLNVCFLRNGVAWFAREREITPPPDGLWPPTTDPRVKAIVALAPWNGPIFGEAGAAAITLPTLVMVGTKDEVTPAPRDAFFIYENLGSQSKVLVIFQNAGHNIFSGLCGLDPADQMRYCADPVWDMARAHDLINHFATAFILATLKGDAAAAKALAPGAVDFVGVDYQASGTLHR